MGDPDLPHYPIYQQKIVTLCRSQDQQNKFHARRIVNETIISGNLDNLQWLSREIGPIPWEWKSLELAIRYGYLEIVKLLQMVDSLSQAFLNTAAKYGQLEIMKWMRSTGYRWDVDTFEAAAANLEVMKWMRNPEWLDPETGKMIAGEPCPWNALAFIAVVSSSLTDGNFDRVKWIWDQRESWDDGKDWITKCYKLAVGNLQMLRWLHDQGVPIPRDEKLLVAAVETGILENIKWLLEKGVDFSPKSLEIAYHRGDREIFKFLSEEAMRRLP